MKEIKKMLTSIMVTAAIVMVFLWVVVKVMPEWSLHNRVVLMACTGCGLLMPWLFLVARWKKSSNR